MTTPAATSLASFHFPVSENDFRFPLSRMRCYIHPSVILTMLQAHDRLSPQNMFAIGTLLGTVSASGTKGSSLVIVEIDDCFANTFQWDAENSALTIHKEPYEWMLKLKEKVNPKFIVLGWCCTAEDLMYTTALSDWAQSEFKVSHFVPSKLYSEPIHLMINPKLNAETGILKNIKAYVRGSLYHLYHEVPVEIVMHPSDISGISSIIRASSSLIDNDPRVLKPLNKKGSSIHDELQKLNSLLTHSIKYVNAVIEGKTEGDSKIGRELLKAFSYASMHSKRVENTLQSQIKDHFMIASLINLARLQFSVAERLSMSLEQ